MNPQLLLVTQGDPCGLGPELVCRALAGPLCERTARILADMQVLIIGPRGPLEHFRARFDLAPFWSEIHHPDELADRGPGVYSYAPPDLEPREYLLGHPTCQGGRAAGAGLDVACELLTTGRAAGVVTGPLNKAMLQEAGYDFPGHTEFLAARDGLDPDEVVMHLAGPKLRVSLVTTHPPLRDVADLITFQRVLRTIRLTAEHLADMHICDTPMAVCGLNPHAGEWGRIGREEIEVIIPAVEEARRQGYRVEGPFAADTLFHRAAEGEFAAVVAMYHDQGLAPLKLLHFGQAVNVTLGLSFVRTSVDHGTGYDLVGRGTADLSSFRAALETALLMTGGHKPGCGS